METKEKTKTVNYDMIGRVKVFNFEGIERTGTREMKPIDEKKLLDLTFTCLQDPKTGVWYGIVIGTSPKDGRPLFKRLRTTGKRTFYLENNEDAEEYHLWKLHYSTLGSPYQKGKPMQQLYDRRKEAVIKLKKIKRGMEATGIALKLAGTELFDFARNLGISPENNDAEVVHELVAERAQKRPDEFLDKYSDLNRGILEIINRARSVSLIKYKIDTGLVFKESYPLGSSDIMAIGHLKDKPELLEAINLESKKLSKYQYGTETPDVKIRDDGKDIAVEVTDKPERERNTYEQVPVEEQIRRFEDQGTEEDHLTEEDRKTIEKVTGTKVEETIPASID